MGIEEDKVIAEVKAYQADARTQLNAMDSVQAFEMAGECLDRKGELTRALLIDLDGAGALGMYFEEGNPLEFDGQGDAPRENTAMVSRYIRLMANVDLTLPENQKAVGFEALGRARRVVRNFFTARLVIEFPLPKETAKSDTTLTLVQDSK